MTYANRRNARLIAREKAARIERLKMLAFGYACLAFAVAGTIALAALMIHVDAANGLSVGESLAAWGL